MLKGNACRKSEALRASPLSYVAGVEITQASILPGGLGPSSSAHAVSSPGGIFVNTFQTSGSNATFTFYTLAHVSLSRAGPPAVNSQTDGRQEVCRCDDNTALQIIFGPLFSLELPVRCEKLIWSSSVTLFLKLLMLLSLN